MESNPAKSRTMVAKSMSTPASINCVLTHNTRFLANSARPHCVQRSEPVRRAHTRTEVNKAALFHRLGNSQETFLTSHVNCQRVALGVHDDKAASMLQHLVYSEMAHLRRIPTAWFVRVVEGFVRL
jgi:hypothetical protein